MISAFMTTAVRLFTGAQARWKGCDPQSSRTRIYFANHTSHLDFVLLWSALPSALRSTTRPAAGRDYWAAGRFRRRLAEGIFNAILIERRNVSRESNPLAQLLAVLATGSSIIIFPEGTRNPAGGPIGPFKSGLYHLSRHRPDVEFVPVYLENLNRVLPKGQFLPVPVLCSVTFGTPLVLEPDESKTSFLQRSREAIIALGNP